MATQIHGAGPSGQRSPGLDLAIAGYLTDNPPAGTGGSGVTATDAPTAPAEGTSASYLVTSAVTWPAGLVWSTDPDGGVAPTITDAALVSLFTVDGTTYAVLGSTYPAPSAPDETDPTAGTLGVVLTSTTADGTVTGAADETELHATPYSFRIDAGTWSAWQAGATYEWTGLTASTEYDFQHRVRDAAGNIAEGTVVTDSTDAPSADTTDPTPGTLAASAITSTSFTLTVTGASDETALHATPYAFSTDNGVTWSAWQAGATFNATELDPETEYTCQHKVRDAALNEATGSSIPVETGGGSVTPLTITHTADGDAKSNVPAPLTWSALNIGTPSATRRIVVALSAYRSSDLTGFSDTLALTIGGVAATRHFPGIAATQRLVTMFSAVVPTGATADIVATATMTPAGSDRFNVSVWAIDGAPSAFQAPSDSEYNNNTTNGVSLAAPTVNGSVTLFAAWSVASGQTFTWTGATAGPTTSNSSPAFTQTSASVTSSDDDGVAASVLCSGINITGSAATWVPA